MNQSIVSLWVNACVRPRETIQAVVEHDPAYLMWPNIFIVTLLGAVNSAVSRDLTGSSWVLVALLMPVVIIVLIYLSGWAYAWTGRWLGGAAGSEVLRAAIIWALPASAVSSLFSMIIELTMPSLGQLGLLIGALLSFAVAIWGLSISVRFISQLQGFSIGRAISNLLLAMMVFMLPGIALAIVIPLMR